MKRTQVRVFAAEFTPVLTRDYVNLGQWQIRATSQGVCRIVLPTRRHETFPEDSLLLAVSSDSEAQQATEHLYATIRQLNEYFAGDRRNFTVPLNPAQVTSFQEGIHYAIRGIPYGETWSYQQLAAAAGVPKAVRAVGTACGMNPLPVIVPCHRVIRSDGSMGYYTGGAEYKRALLRLETPRI